jgi:hypothetical protein
MLHGGADLLAGRRQGGAPLDWTHVGPGEDAPLILGQDGPVDVMLHGGADLLAGRRSKVIPGFAFAGLRSPRPPALAPTPCNP